MSNFNNNYNLDNSIIRSSIVGLVNELNNRIQFENVWSNDKRETVKVPFFYAMSGDERFLQDAFSNWSDCYPDFIEGNADPIPRGSLTLSGISVMPGNLTSRYVRGYYTKEIDGELKRYNSTINSIPLQLNFDAKIMFDTMTDGFKIVQSCIEHLYRTLSFSITFGGFRVPTQAGFPDSFVLDKQFEYTYGITDRNTVAFSIEMETYFPIVDNKQELFAGNRIENFTLE